jgi:hypothetical protein
VKIYFLAYSVSGTADDENLTAIGGKLNVQGDFTTFGTEGGDSLRRKGEKSVLWRI